MAKTSPHVKEIALIVLPALLHGAGNSIDHIDADSIKKLVAKSIEIATEFIDAVDKS